MKDHKIWRLAMRSITQDRILPRKLGKWIRKFIRLIAKTRQQYCIFRKLHTSKSRSNEEKFIFSEIKTNYTEETVPTTVRWQGYSPHIIIMQGFTRAENSYFIQKKENNIVINNTYIKIDDYENKN